MAEDQDNWWRIILIALATGLVIGLLLNLQGGELKKIKFFGSEIVFPSTSHQWNLTNFEVKADIPKNRTGLIVESGDTMHFEYAYGQWGSDQNGGMTTGCGWRSDDPDDNHVWPMPPEQRGAALIGYIGNEPFFIGCETVEIVAKNSGELYLGMSECRDCYWDNSGALYVNVAVND